MNRPMPRTPTNESKVVASRAGTVAVRTTIPAHITQQMDVVAGDTLLWKLDKVRGRWVATILKK